ncbi:hypothetical protein [Gemmatimonas sp.]|uniref:hypothetical protein n=1 Tax=Gemmatimonas sp. TaxID=1962908 RepID=UPI00391FBF26
MPIIPFDALPDEARVWVFAAAAPITGAAAAMLLDAVDAHLREWRAHGVPLVCARAWRDDRFLAIGVDEAASNASGCSIDALFHALRALEAQLGTSMVGTGAVYWRDAQGRVASSSRPQFRTLAASGGVLQDTKVFDTTVMSAGAWRRDFEVSAQSSWHARFLSPPD